MGAKLANIHPAIFKASHYLSVVMNWAGPFWSRLASFKMGWAANRVITHTHTCKYIHTHIYIYPRALCFHMSLWLLKLCWKEDEVTTLTRAYLLLQFYHQTPIQVYACSSSSRGRPDKSFCCSCNESSSHVDHLAKKSRPLCWLCAQMFQKGIIDVFMCFLPEAFAKYMKHCNMTNFLLKRKY